MEGGPVLSVEGLRDEHVATDGVDVVDAARGLICPGSRDAVADAHIFVLIGADLEAEENKQDCYVFSVVLEPWVVRILMWEKKKTQKTTRATN